MDTPMIVFLSLAVGLLAGLWIGERVGVERGYNKALKRVVHRDWK